MLSKIESSSFLLKREITRNPQVDGNKNILLEFVMEMSVWFWETMQIRSKYRLRKTTCIFLMDSLMFNNYIIEFIYLKKYF